MARVQVYATMQVFETLFSWIRGVENSIMSIDEVLERAQDAVYRYGIRGLVIDPYNEMEHQRKSNQTETEYVSRLLSKVSPPLRCSLADAVATPRLCLRCLWWRYVLCGISVSCVCCASMRCS